MRLTFEFERYESKLATLCSVMKHNFIAGISFFLFVFNIPTYICGICGTKFTLMVFGIMSGISVVAWILFAIFINPDKIDDRLMAKKRAKRQALKEQQRKELENYYNNENVKRRAIIGTQIAESLSKSEQEEDNKGE